MSARKLKLIKRLRIPNLNIELKLKSQGYTLIAGVDEVGSGSWAGPVAAGAVILPEKRLYRLRDSKLLLPKEREELSIKIKREAKAWKVAFVSEKFIDAFGLHQAVILAYKKAIRGLGLKPDFILTDYYKIPRFSIPHQPVEKGDMKVLSIAAASIIAKVERDALMVELSQDYPIFEFHQNKGYPSPVHKKALKIYGLCPLHRRRFSPIAKLLVPKTPPR